jgi:uncharacterized glyoxalase superfamily protein PhnB
VLGAADWLCAAFGFRKRLHAGDGHAQLSIDDSGGVMLSKSRIGQGLAAPDTAEMRQPLPNEVTHLVHVHVADVDAHHAHATAGGATVERRLETMPWGERRYEAFDLEGHWWHFAQRL